MTALVAAAPLTRFAFRRDRVRIAVWILAIVLLVWTTAASTKGIYATQADLDEAAAASRDNPAALAFNGPDQALDTIGGQVAFQIGAFGFTMAALMSLFTVTRLTRAEEESGRLELVRSLPVGSLAPLASAFALVTAMNVVVGALVTLTLLLTDLAVAGSLVLGAGFTLVGLVFAGVAAVVAQVTENPRVASGVTGAVVGAAFVLRAVGDVGGGALSWLSPIGWAQKARPYAGERWWPLLLCALVAVALGAAAVALSSRRDVGGGLVAPRPGPAVASRSLDRPLGLAVRLQRATLWWWTLGVLALAAIYGSLAVSIDDFVGDNEALRDFLARTGGNLTDAYLSTSLAMMATLGAAFAVQSALRLRTEEANQRAEPLLATPVSRASWMWSHLGVALGGSVLVLAAAGVGMGVAYAATGGGVDQVPRLLGAGLTYVPAVWTFVGVATALYGLAPRVAPLSWAVLGGCVVILFFGTLFDLPAWLVELSPIERTPQLPVADIRALPLLALTAVAAGFVALGIAGFRRRDLGS